MKSKKLHSNLIILGVAVLLSGLLTVQAFANEAFEVNAISKAQSVEGRVKDMYPEIVLLQTDQGLVEVDIVDIDVETMNDFGVQFLQLGDTMEVGGEYVENDVFDADLLLNITPYAAETSGYQS